jgi:hypothetical protein
MLGEGIPEQLTDVRYASPMPRTTLAMTVWTHVEPVT